MTSQQFRARSRRSGLFVCCSLALPRRIAALPVCSQRSVMHLPRRQRESARSQHGTAGPRFRSLHCGSRAAPLRHRAVSYRRTSRERWWTDDRPCCPKCRATRCLFVRAGHAASHVIVITSREYESEDRYAAQCWEPRECAVRARPRSAAAISPRRAARGRRRFCACDADRPRLRARAHWFMSAASISQSLPSCWSPRNRYAPRGARFMQD